VKVYDDLNLSPSWQAGLTVTATLTRLEDGSKRTVQMPEDDEQPARYVLQVADADALAAGTWTYVAKDGSNTPVGSSVAPFSVNATGDLATLAAAAAGGGGNVGPGASPNVLTIEVGGIAVPDADVWITSDEAGTVVVAGTLQTNSEGKTTALLDSGVTYYVWMQKDGENPILGKPFVAE
jgi:hypothetical protein